MSKTETEKIMEILLKTERVADEILKNKHEIISLDKKRQETREAIREIKNNDEKKVWTSVGSLMIKMPKDKALHLLTKDQIEIDVEINKLRSQQKVLVNEHRDLEHLSPFSGTNLIPMSSKEMSAFRANLPLN